MVRKLLVVAAAITIPVSVVAVGGGLASAANPHTGASGDSISCKDISGTVSFSPKLTSSGYKSGTVKDKISAKVSGCTVTGSTKETVSQGTVSGTISGAAGTSSKPTGTCSGLSGYSTDTGTLTISWKATPAAGNSTLQVKSVYGTVSKSGYGLFDIPGKVKSVAGGSFVGSDKGAKDKSVAQTTSKASSILSTCSKSGLSSIGITQESGTTAVTLG